MRRTSISKNAYCVPTSRSTVRRQNRGNSDAQISFVVSLAYNVSNGLEYLPNIVHCCIWRWLLTPLQVQICSRYLDGLGYKKEGIGRNKPSRHHARTVRVFALRDLLTIIGTAISTIIGKRAILIATAEGVSGKSEIFWQTPRRIFGTLGDEFWN